MDWNNKLNQTIARWDTTGVKDDYGKLSYNVNDQIIGRWMYNKELVIDREGKEFNSEAHIYTTAPISDESYFELDENIVGDSNPKARINSRLARKIERHYNVIGNETLYKVFL